MPSTEKIRGDLRKKIAELFQLDRPDLDFGFYRIMHAKAEEVDRFITADLLKDIEEIFGKIDDARKSELKSRYESALRQARDFGAPDPEAAPAVKEARAAYESFKSEASAEAEVYDHLLRFFSRYYETGDFIARRYYARENAGQAAPYAVPYSGEEVKLHWGNADQYYVKSTEYFSNFTFDLNRNDENEKPLIKEEIEPLRAHFRIVDASEGEHGNIKTASDKKRFFLLHENDPVGFDENGELVVNFEYRDDPAKTGQDNTWQERCNAAAAETLRKRLVPLRNAAKYRNALFAPAPTEKNPRRTVLDKYLMQYTARNTMDYFIHKNLGEFLHRELDFYIKNEVMRLDDIDDADAPSVRSYLEKIKVIRGIGGKLIDFLAQLENFQKKLWLKKKFVTETNYCITLDRIPEEFYPEIAADKAQHAEWIELFAIDEIEKTLTSPGYTKKLSVEFLKANDKLVLDTKHFDAGFKARLLESLENFDDRCDGLLVHSENFQALNLLRERYREQVKCVYIDPPYNTSASEIAYKNSYKHSSWLSLMYDRISRAKTFLNDAGVHFVAIDDVEGARLQLELDECFGEENRLGNIVVLHNPGGRHDDKHIATSHEYCFVYGKKPGRAETYWLPLDEETVKSFKQSDDTGAFRTREFKRSGNNSTREARPFLFYPLLLKDGDITLVDKQESDSIYDKSKKRFDDAFLEKLKTKYEAKGFVFLLPIDPQGVYRVWRWGPETLLNRIDKVYYTRNKAGNYIVKTKDMMDEKPGLKPKSAWFKSKYSGALGTTLVKNMIGDSLFSYPKALDTVKDSIVVGCREGDCVLDYFAGSGTTGHAVIDLNRDDESKDKRKYVLIEMGDYFNTVLHPRIVKAVYANDWKQGKPRNRDTGVSHCFKYIRLESYEDTLNNLRFDADPAGRKLLAKSKSLREDYMLNYMLDVETRGSRSLLNIDAFAEPDKYLLRIKKANSDALEEKPVDLPETFNFLIGLRVDRSQAPQRFHAEFKNVVDPDLPKGQKPKRTIKGKLEQKIDGKWMFRAVYGRIPKNPLTPNDGLREKVLVVWRNLTGNIEEDNIVLDEWFRKNRINPGGLESDTVEFDTVYVNGSNNLPNVRRNDENWKVRLIEEEFFKRMWDIENF